jgi:hypothetical protein
MIIGNVGKPGRKLTTRISIALVTKANIVTKKKNGKGSDHNKHGTKLTVAITEFADLPDNC